MPQSPNADDDRRRAAHSSREPALEVDVARTGGFAGLTRRWSAQPPEGEASDWLVLIDRCPWDDAVPAPLDAPEQAGSAPVADGFVWWIRASRSNESAREPDLREAELADDQVTGAWRE
ncbi:MAG TPA: hypothetical protein VJU58_09755, partial [Microbacterium sp.]|nr:hypothetical protein [Microbacterium sp.]